MRQKNCYAAVQCDMKLSKSNGSVFGNRTAQPVRAPDHSHEVMRIGIVELEACALVKHVRVDPVRAQQRDAFFALGPLLLQPRQLGGQGDDLLVEFLPRVEAVFAGCRR